MTPHPETCIYGQRVALFTVPLLQVSLVCRQVTDTTTVLGS